jgi:cell division protein ZipA
MMDLLAILVIVAIVVVLLDGVRRKLRDRRGRVVLKLDRNLSSEDINLDEIPLSELPNGGARRLERQSAEIPVIRRKPPVLPSIKKAREAGEAPPSTVPVLMETVELDEEEIEHTNVFANGGAVDTFVAEEFDEEDIVFDDDEDDEIIDGLDEEYAADVSARRGSREAERIVDVEELDDEFDDELELEVEQQLVPDELIVDADDVQVPEVLADLDEEEELDFDEDDDDFEDDDEQASPARQPFARSLNEADDFDENLEDPFDEEIAEDDFEEEDEGESTDSDLDEDEDELDFDEELPDEYEDDYENEPLLLQDVYKKAAGHFKRPVEQRPRIEPGFGGAAFHDDELEEDFSSAFLDDPELNEELQEEMRPIPVVPRSAPRPNAKTEPPRVQTAHPSYDAPVKPTPAESWPPKTAVPVPPAPVKRLEPARSIAKKVDQGELFREENLRKAAELEQKQEPAGPQEVIIINVMARQGAMFSGTDLLPVLRKQGLHLGEMSIFHRHAELDGSGQVMFSMANMVKPGTFNLAAMETFSTPGVSFFLQLPNKLGNLPSFEKMLAAANAVKVGLDGEFKDENRSVFTRQTVEHCRQRIQDFELALLKRK